MQFTSTFLLATASLVAVVTANSHDVCWCEWSGFQQRSTQDQQTQAQLVTNACAGYPSSYPFFNDNKQIPSTGIKLTSYNQASSLNYPAWRCVATLNGKRAAVIGGNEWQKECINAARATKPQLTGVVGYCTGSGSN